MKGQEGVEAAAAPHQVVALPIPSPLDLRGVCDPYTTPRMMHGLRQPQQDQLLLCRDPFKPAEPGQRLHTGLSPPPVPLPPLQGLWSPGMCG